MSFRPDLDRARSPRTTPEELRRLSKDWAWDVRAEVAQNPNCPLDVLFALSDKDAHLVAKNLAWPMLLLESPDLLGKAPFKLVEALAGSEHAPLILGWLRRKPSWLASTLIVLVANPVLPLHTRRELFCADPFVTRQRMGDLSRLEGPLGRGWIDLLRKGGLSRNGYQPAQLTREEAVELAGFGNLGELLAASSPNLPPELQLRVAASASFDVRLALAHNPSLVDEALERLAADPVRTLPDRLLIEAKPHQLPRLLDVMARVANRRVKLDLARRDDLSDQASQALARDPDRGVRRELAKCQAQRERERVAAHVAASLARSARSP